MRPKTVDDYIELVRQAVFEVEELRHAVEYDEEYMGSTLKFLDTLEQQVRSLYESMEKGEYVFADEDLPFMDIVSKQDSRSLPFGHMLKVINETHRKGLDTG